MRNSGHTKQRSHMQQQQEQQHSVLESYTGKLHNAQAVNKCSWDNACMGHVPKKKRGISVISTYLMCPRIWSPISPVSYADSREMGGQNDKRYAEHYLCDAFAIVGISVVDRQALSPVVIAPRLLVPLADHINPVHDEQPWLVQAPDWNLGMTRGKRYPAYTSMAQLQHKLLPAWDAWYTTAV